ncbi:DUF1156 domain-containing protein [Runella rosea]|uniref:DUF1156 domain-containing protein n=1 Tax=Runella rosea TaxID=2259595 RepID=A0A344TDH3_9BACT|nr:DUF1156 domain-containing protein [Runella rosea]AXE16694.1 DUF1156 domain-containing protein [Runella rosea]
MTAPKKLIEVAMPIKEISAESVRDKSIRHGHISTLHLWWARRPLPVCRAVVFASLVPDPLDPNCPQAFRDSVEILLGKENNPGDPYAPYKDIPWTAVFDPMEDSLRNRLQMFIGKFTEDMQQALLHSRPSPAAGKQLSDASLIKWDNKNNEAIINKARKLIFVAHNSLQASAGSNPKSADELLKEFEELYSAVKNTETELYSLSDRHLETDTSKQLTVALNQAIESFLDRMPKVFDPFAGGGAIPLEAARLGCRTYGNDINPVAHIIQKGSLEFPQKYGKPITYSKSEFENLYGRDELKKWCKENGKHPDTENLKIEIPNRLSFDVEFYAKKLINNTENEIGHLYPADEKGNKPIAYYWTRIATCSNPSCRAEVPLLRQFYLVNKPDKKYYLSPTILDKKIDFEIAEGSCEVEGFVSKGNLLCPCCKSITDVKSIRAEIENGSRKVRLIAVIYDTPEGKRYRLPTELEQNIITPEIPLPSELLPKALTGGSIMSWGYKTWGEMFTSRQLYALQTLIQNLNLLKQELLYIEESYRKAIITYLAILIDRGTAISTSFGRWDVSREGIQSPFSKQAIPMMFDYPEGYLLGNNMGSLLNQLDWITRYIESENDYPFSVELKNASSGDKSQFSDKHLTAVITDPPYYDAIAYADLSDFFYVWLKRMLNDIYPLNFATPQTPKSEECTALKHHHNNNKNEAKQHFEDKLTQIFDAIEHQTSEIVSIMFAHQSTEAWTTLCNSILGARMNITGSWPMDTEMANRSLGLSSSALGSSVTVSCKPAQSRGYGDYKEVKKAVEKTVAKEVTELYKLGFRGADLLTACFGQAVSEFGQYNKVEKADGTEVTVAELLELARESAFNALLKGFDGDDFTKFYIGWLQLYGFAESEFDDAAKFSRVGLTINVNELFTEHLLIKKGNKQTLGNYQERIAINKRLGENKTDTLIDQVHRAMHLYAGANRSPLLAHIAAVADSPESAFWRVVTSLLELLPAGCNDHKQATGLLSNRDSLIRESKQASENKVIQGNLFG